MQRILLCAALLVSTATLASASGINLSWSDCGAFGQLNRNSTCTSNTGNNILTASYDPPTSLPTVIGNNLILDVQTASDPLPDWWDLHNGGSCRGTAGLAGNVLFGTSCVDIWQGVGFGGITGYLTIGTNRRRMGFTYSGSEGFAPVLSPGTEYYSFNVNITNAKTTGAGACDGCLDAACIVLNEILVSQPPGTPGGSPVITIPLSRNYVTWQGGAVGGAGCPGATPSLNRTWGQIKSIYR